MSSSQHIENPDVVLIGSGVMSATLGALLKNLQPDLKIQLYEVTKELAQESSNGWHNGCDLPRGLCVRLICIACCGNCTAFSSSN